MTLIGAALPILLSALAPASPQRAAPAPDSAALVRRIAATATLAAQEYRIGVVGGKVVAAAEVEEARLFLQEARRVAGSLTSAAPAPAAGLDSLLTLVQSLAPADTLDARVRAFAAGLAERYHVSLDEVPARHAGPGPRRRAVSRQLRRLPRRPGAGRRPAGSRPRSRPGEPGRLGRAAGPVASRLLSPGQHRGRRHRHAGVRGAAVPRGPVGPRPLRVDAAPAPSDRRSPPSCPASARPAGCPTPPCSTRWAPRWTGRPADSTGSPRSGPRSRPAPRRPKSWRRSAPRSTRSRPLARTGKPGAGDLRAHRLHDLRAGGARAARQGRRPRGRAGERLRRAPGRRDPGSGPRARCRAAPAHGAARSRRPRPGRGTVAGQPLRAVLRDHAARRARSDPDRRCADDLPRQNGRRRAQAPSQRGDPRRHRGEPAHRA